MGVLIELLRLIGAVIDLAAGIVRLVYHWRAGRDADKKEGR